ncbi:MAG: FG-GAP-like repeat-containing protein, partial [bacterium]
IGKKLAHYLIEQKLGAGGMGVVYKAQDLRLLRSVAIKILPSDLVAEEESRLRFVREARAASALNHPNICTVHDIGEHNGVHFMVMELVEGQTLRQVLEERGPLTEVEVVDIALKVCDALNAAHDKGIIHRDIKPDNIMISREGYVKVMDFGLAKLATEKAEAVRKVENKSQKKDPKSEADLFASTLSNMLGTLSYMSPEQARGKPVDHRSDIFSFGVVLYELLTGKPPFEAKSNITTLEKILDEEPPAIQKMSNAISPWMAGIVDKMLQKDPEERYHSLLDLLRVLEGSLEKASFFRKYRVAITAVSLLILSMIFYYALSIRTDFETIAVQPLRHLFNFGSSGIGDGQFNQPSGMAISKSGKIIITDEMNHRIQVFDELGNFMFRFGAFGTGKGEFNQPKGVAINSQGSILVTDEMNHRVQVFDSTGSFLSEFGSSGSGDGQFDRPQGIAVDKSSGNILVVDHFNDRVQAFDSSGKFLFRFGTVCYLPGGQNCSDPDDSGPLEPGDGQFWNPSGVAFDSSGHIIVSDSENHRVQVFDSAGNFLFKFGSHGSGNGQFNRPRGISIDQSGNIMVVDSGNNRIQAFDSSGNFLYEFGSAGSGEGELNNPRDLVVDEPGNILVSDTFNQRIQLFGTPIFTTVSSGVGISASGGAVFGFFDFDNDRDMDLFIQPRDAPDVLYQNNGAPKGYSFSDVSAKMGFHDRGEGGGSLNLIDYNNDGFVDIFLSKNGLKLLYKNNGDGSFMDVASVSGITDTSRSRISIFGDYNNDGFLDLYLINSSGNSVEPAILYKNNGPPDWNFTNVASEAGVEFRGYGHGCNFVDYDDDGDQDIYISTYKGSNLLYRNNGDGTFVDVAPQAGLAVGARSRGTVFRDYDNDGDLDLYVTRGVFHTPFSNFLFRNDGPPNWTFSEVTNLAGVGHKGDGSTSALGDYDNDGDLDLYVANTTNQANVLYHNKGDGTFANMTPLAGVANPLTGGLAAFGDYNNDGFLDIYAVNNDGQHILYENRGNSNYWLKIKLVGMVSNRDGFGSRITVSTEYLTQTREVDGGNLGFGFQCSRPEHFGFGAAARVDRIEVKWPSGIITTLTGVVPNQTLTIVEGDSAFRPMPSL